MVIFGAGAATPCILSLGGDQYTLPQQKEQLTSFFSFVHFFAHIGFIFAGLVSPLLRKYVRCFDEDTCYPMVFGALEVLVVTGISMCIIRNNRSRKIFVFFCSFFMDWKTILQEDAHRK